MLAKLLPLILLLAGTGAGLGAGLVLRPAPAPLEKGDKAAAKAEAGAEAPATEKKDAKADKKKEGKDSSPAFLKLSNQFVVPLVRGGTVTSLVVLSLSLEVPETARDGVFWHEPKLRDSFLQVLFDHANSGGFEGAFTAPEKLAPLRLALRERAQKDLGKERVTDVLITEIARQDY